MREWPVVFAKFPEFVDSIMKRIIFVLVRSAFLVLAVVQSGMTADPATALVKSDVVFQEQAGLISAEAEHFYKQTQVDQRAWYLHSSDAVTNVKPDGDPGHVPGASGGAYLEILPDTRKTHADKLVNGQNFTNTPGVTGILHYKVHVQNPGRYYVWVRAFSSGSEDNGLHVGLDGKWPESGQRLQWCEGKSSWRWESRQRTEKVHCGVPGLIFLDIDEPGEHEIMFSMREDGFEFDKWFMTTNPKFTRPVDTGPSSLLKSGKLPPAFKLVQVKDVEPEMSLEPIADPLTVADPLSSQPSADVRGQDGDWSVSVSGELKPWHKVTFTLSGPFADERDQDPNPFTDMRMTVFAEHESGWPKYTIPGYFAADGQASETSAQAGNKWRAHLSPDRTGTWNYSVLFEKSRGVIYLPPNGKSIAQGSFQIAATDGADKESADTTSEKTSRDFRGKGRLQYVGKHYLQFTGSKEYFLKAGPDSPETLLAYAEFDGTIAGKKKVPLKTWQPHVRDWKAGDPTWQDGQGKGLIGAINYLAMKGCNSISFLPYNAGGDGDNVWPFVSRNQKLNYDCSKLDQWQVVFDHAQAKGLHLHFKLQEQEIDDNRVGHKALKEKDVATSLDGGDLGRERKLYCRELIARFGYSLALNWNLGEENTQSTKQQREMAEYIHLLDPYDHHIVVHTFPDQQDLVYPPLTGQGSLLTGASLQNSWDSAHQRTLKFVTMTGRAGKPWVVANDEQGPAGFGVPPDVGYDGSDGFGSQNGKQYDADDIRKHTLWGTLLAGGAGVEYYFGYKLKQNDLLCEDFRSRDQSWDYCRIALGFFREHKIPFHEMKNANSLIGNVENLNSKYCFAKRGELYLVYLSEAATSELDLTGQSGSFSIEWFNPRTGGPLAAGSVKSFNGGGTVSMGKPPVSDGLDWLAIVRRS